MAGNYEWLVKTIKLVTKRDEVKTPLSLLFKIVPWLVAGLGIALYAPAPDGLKVFAIEALLWALGGMVGIVFLFAWFRPKNLVYGESGHRAEHRTEYGTERRLVDPDSQDAIPTETNPVLPHTDRPPALPGPD